MERLLCVSRSADGSFYSGLNRVEIGLGMGLECQGLLGVFLEWNVIIDAWCVYGLIPGALCTKIKFGILLPKTQTLIVIAMLTMRYRKGHLSSIFWLA